MFKNISSNALVIVTVLAAILFVVVDQTNADTKVQFVEIQTEVPVIKEIYVDKPVLKVQVQPEELLCLTKNIFFESRNQSNTGMIAVARVTMNRVNDSRYPSTVCKVVQQGPIRESWKTKGKDVPESDRTFYPVRSKCAFSWYCDGKKDEIKSEQNNHAWRLASDIAFSVLAYNRWAGIVDGSTHYHADYVLPGWARTLVLVTKIDDHVFYRWD